MLVKVPVINTVTLVELVFEVHHIHFILIIKKITRNVMYSTHVIIE